MTDPDWNRVQEVFHRATELDTLAREDFLRAVGAEEPDLAARVGRMVSAEDGDDFLTDAIETVARGAAASQGGFRVGSVVGVYRLERVIGEGGMGTVYEARRADGAFDRRVAIKVIRGALSGGDAFRRFMAERNILARLTHPNVARLLDAGRTDDGVPYMVMEYVEGVPIDRYCDEAGLSLGQRVALFEQVCDAVRAAHQNFVVHRDLKPANILVTPEGVPKLLDFGIAKLLESRSMLETLVYTATGTDVLTPAYASPEQLRGQPITVATDIYGLGLVMYELLTGCRAHQFSGRSALEVDRVICRDLPPAPSRLFAAGRSPVGEDATSAQTRADLRGAAPPQLRRTLEGDLGTIVMMALRKEPERRYGSVDALMTDLVNLREGRPVSAQRDSKAYRIRRFVGRHRWGVAATAMVTFLVLTFSGITAWQNVRISDERDTAELRRQVAAEVSDFLVSVFGSAEPESGEGVPPEVVLEEGQARLRALEGRPAVRAGMTAALGRLFHQFGYFEESFEALSGALAQRDALFGPDSGEVASSLQLLGDLLMDMGRTPEAEENYRRALALRSGLLPETHPERIQSQMGLARSLAVLGRLDEANRLHSDALDAQSAIIDPLGRADLQFEMADVLFASGSVRSARAWADSAWELRSAQLDETDDALQASRIQRERFGPDNGEPPILTVLPIQQHQAPIPTPFGTLSGDFDGDGRVDLAWNHLGETNQIYVGMARGDGTFAVGAAIEVPVPDPPYGWSLYEAAVGDFDGDGLDDLIWNGRRENNYWVVGESNGDGTFSFTPVQGTQWRGEHLGGGYYWGPTNLIVGDVNGDGADDLVWWEPRQMNHWAALSNGDGSLELVQPLRSYVHTTEVSVDRGAMVDQVLLARLEGSPGLSLVWGQWEAYNSLTIARWAGRPDELWAAEPTTLHWGHYDAIYEGVGAWHHYQMLVADLDGDSYDDVLWVDPATPFPPADADNRVYTAIVSGSDIRYSELRQDRLVGDDPGPFEVRTGDLDGDGLADLVWNDRNQTGENRVYRSWGGPGGVFTSDVAFQLRPEGGDWSRADLFVGDFDGDGLDDLLWNRTGALNRVYVSLSRGR